MCRRRSEYGSGWVRPRRGRVPRAVRSSIPTSSPASNGPRCPNARRRRVKATGARSRSRSTMFWSRRLRAESTSFRIARSTSRSSASACPLAVETRIHRRVARMRRDRVRVCVRAVRRALRMTPSSSTSAERSRSRSGCSSQDASRRRRSSSATAGCVSVIRRASFAAAAPIGRRGCSEPGTRCVRIRTVHTWGDVELPVLVPRHRFVHCGLQRVERGRGDVYAVEFRYRNSLGSLRR